MLFATLDWSAVMKLETPPLIVTSAPRLASPAAALGAAFVLLWCTGYPAAKLALAHAAPLTLLVLRFGSAAMLLALLAVFAGVSWPRGRTALHSVVTGALSLALQFGALYVAVALGVNVGIAALVIGMTPIATALISRALGEALSSRQWLGFAFGAAGVVLAVADRIGTSDAPWFAYLLLLLGLAGIGAGTVYQKRFAVDVDPRAGLAIQQASATLLLLPFALNALHATEFEYGIQEGVTSVGFVVGSLMMAKWADRLREGSWIVIGLVAMGLAGVLYGVSTSIPLAILLVTISGFFNAPNSIARRVIQETGLIEVLHVEP